MGTQRQQRQIESARRNGARSRAPVTAQGKRRSSPNASTHGRSSQTVIVVANESPEDFEALARAYVQRFAPRHGVGSGMIQELAAGVWRIRRAWSLETGLLAKSLDKQPQGNQTGRLASAFRHAAGSAQLGLLNRHEAHLQVTFRRCLRDVAILPDPPVSPSPRRPVSTVGEA